MKKMIFLWVLLLTITACTQNGYVINGTVDDGKENSPVYLATLTEGIGVVPIDSTLLRNGKFTLKGKQDTAAIRFIFYHNGDGVLRNSMVVVENVELNVHLGAETVVEGSPMNDAVRTYYSEVKQISTKYGQLQELIAGDTTITGDDRTKLVNNMMGAMEKEVNAVMMNNLLRNLDNPLGAYLLKSIYTTMDAATILPLFDKIPPMYRDEQLLQAALIVAETVKRNEAAEKYGVGKMFADFSVNNRNGKPTSLSETVGTHRLTLVDFWAGWCRPCMLYMPEMIRVYNQYKGKGLGLVGVSLDVDSLVWTSALDSLSIPGIQVCDFGGGNSLPAKLYGVINIPSMMLIGQDGVILEQGLQIDALEEKIKSHLK